MTAAVRFCRLLLLLQLAVQGCAVLGPASIKGGRASYNEAIVQTNNEQVLAMIVRMRYGEPVGLLAVSSVTANLHIQATLGSEFGIGTESNYEGNLTPLSAGLAYEENPTISYTPVQGEQYMRQLLSPIPMDLTVLLLNALGHSPQAAALLLRSINEIQNPQSAVDASSRFGQVLDVLAALTRAGNLAWTQRPAGDGIELTFSGSGEEYATQVKTLYDLLGFESPSLRDARTSLPVRAGFGRPPQPAIELRSRSLFELFGLAAAAVEVPEEHLRSGLAPAGAEPAAGPYMRIHATDHCPRGAMIAVKHHGYWYAIDGADTASKLTFRIIEALMSVRMAETIGRAPAPLLTVPVSR